MDRAEYLKQIRKKLGLTQTEMAKRLGYGNQKDISRIETGKANMSNQVLEHLKTIEECMKTVIGVPKSLKK